MPSRIFLFPLLLLLASCGTQVSFKQGGDAGDFSAADRDCRAPGKNYEQCMQAAGWSVHKTNNLSFNPLSVPVQSDNRSPGVASGAAPSPTGVPVKKDEKGNVLPPDPTTKFNVAAWGKMGGSADSLKADTDSCVTKLGPAHKPEPDSPMMTLGLIMCLKEKGWSGLQGY